MEENNKLSGLEDVPVISQDYCGRCNDALTKTVHMDNFSGWFGFMKVESQMYQVPLCVSCSDEDSKGGPAAKE